MLNHPRTILLCSAAALGLSACSDFDVDMRRADTGFSTTEAARQATAARPRPDARGIISYPDYQVVVARPGDTVAAVAQRVGLAEGELARFNALDASTSLRGGEVLALPRKIDGTGTGSAPSAPSGNIEISTLADTAIARAEGTAPAQPAAPRVVTQPAAEQPTRHRVERGETAFQIARLYNVAPRALSDWNGLDPEMRVREGQMLMIPVANQSAPVQTAAAPAPTPTPAPTPAPEPTISTPGAGSATPLPPSASTPLPPPEPSANEAAAAVQEARPPSPTLSQERTAATQTRFVMPVDGRIIRAYSPPRNEGIGIAAPAGTAVKAAGAGTVSRIVRTTNNVTFIILAHGDQISTVYANVDGVTVSEGARVTQGQTIARVAASESSNLHFEVRRGTDSQDPMRFLQ